MRSWPGRAQLGYFSIRNDIDVTPDDFTEPRMPYERFIEVHGILSDDPSVFTPRRACQAIALSVALYQMSLQKWSTAMRK